MHKVCSSTSPNRSSTTHGDPASLASLLLKDNDVVYSSGNAYERMYESEMGDVVHALAVFGQPMHNLLPPLYAFAREKGLAYHDAGFKLQLFATTTG